MFRGGGMRNAERQSTPGHLSEARGRWAPSGNVGNKNRMTYLKWVLETSLTKTLASKFKCKVSTIYRRYAARVLDHKGLQIVIKRPDKDPLVATFGGIPFERIPEGKGVVDFRFELAWFKHTSNRAEVVQRLLAGRCELC